MRYVFFFLLMYSAIASVHAESISKQMKELEHGTEKEIVIKVSQSNVLKVVLDKTMKGNGTLLLGNYSLLRIYDTHNDGYYYMDDVLNIELTDVTGNGFNELVISGVAVQTDEKEKIQGYSEIIYIFSFIEGKYKQVYKKSPIEIDLAKQ